MGSFELCQVFLNSKIYTYFMEIFAQRLKELRLEQGLSQAALAAATNLSQSAIKQWENQSRIPNAKAVLDLAKFFEVTTDYLLGAE